jgi:hypothetical protein
MRKLLVWNAWNIEHIAKHGVSVEEARYVVEHAGGRYPQKVGDGKFVIRGQTAGGRWLQVIFIYLEDEQVDLEMLNSLERMMLEDGEDALYVIHARDLTGREKRRR